MISDINIYTYVKTRVFHSVHTTFLVRRVDIGAVRAISSEDLSEFNSSITMVMQSYENAAA